MSLELDEEDVARVLGSLRASIPGTAELDSLARLELATAAATFFGLDATDHDEALLRGRNLEQWTATTLEGWAAGPRELTFTTSGTTGTPVTCVHPWAAVVEEIEALAEIVGGGRRRVVGLVPPHHIYGFLFCVLLPRRLGVPYVDARSSAMPGVRPGDLVVGFPTRWELAAATGRPVAGDVHGVSSTAPLHPDTADVLEGLGLARMVEVYGSSETGGIGWRDDSRGPFALMDHWRLLDDGRLCRDGGQPLLPPDLIEPCGERSLRVLGRRDGVVQVGGVNVSCARVVEVLRRHPGVVDCAVRPMEPEEGRRLKAFVVADERAATDLQSFIEAELSPPERPTSLTFGPALPADWR